MERPNHEAKKLKKVGHLVLACQFVAGLCQKLKAKVAGRGGNLEQFLTRARSDDKQTKRKDEKKSAATTYAKSNLYKDVQCHECGWMGHIARIYGYANRGRNKEEAKRQQNKKDGQYEQCYN